MTSQARSILLAAALTCAATGVSAQTIYKVVDDAGHTSFSDRPPPKPAATPRRSAKVDMNESARRLRQALQERNLGTEPRPGELSPGAGGRTPNYRYWRRQERNRLVVELAQRRARETLQPQIVARSSPGDSKI